MISLIGLVLILNVLISASPACCGHDQSFADHVAIVSTGAKCDIVLYILQNRILDISIDRLGMPKKQIRVVNKYKDANNGADSKSYWTFDFLNNPHPTIIAGDKDDSKTTLELTDKGCVDFFSGRFDKVQKDDFSIQGDGGGFQVLTTFTKLVNDSVNKSSRQLLYETITSSTFKASVGLKSEPLLFYLLAQMGENMSYYFGMRGVVQLSVRQATGDSQYDNFYFVFSETGPELIKNADLDGTAIDLVLKTDDASLVNMLLDKSNGWIDVLTKLGKGASQFSV